MVMLLDMNTYCIMSYKSWCFSEKLNYCHNRIEVTDEYWYLFQMRFKQNVMNIIFQDSNNQDVVSPFNLLCGCEINTRYGKCAGYWNCNGKYGQTRTVELN